MRQQVSTGSTLPMLLPIFLACLSSQTPAHAKQTLSLRAAVERALRLDPQTAYALLARDRSKLALLRAQLDRVSAKVDASLGEQWRAWKAFSDPACDPTGACAATSGTTTSGTSSFTASLAVPLFTGFRLTANVSRARHLDAAAVATHRATARAVAIEVLRAYWSVRRVELQAAVSEQALSRYQDAVKVVNARVRAGLAPPVDLNRIEARRLREEARLASLKGSAAEGRAQLAVALELGGADLWLTEPIDVPPPPPHRPEEVDHLLASAARVRPELLAAQHRTLAAREAIRAARSGYFPQLGGAMQLQYGNGSYLGFVGGGLMTPSGSANPFANTSLSLLVGATLSINLFDTFNTATAVRDARYVASQQEQDERRLGRLVEQEVRLAHVRLQRLYRTRDPLVSTRSLARDNLTIIDRRYRNGEGTILDYLDAQVELLNAELDLADVDASIALGWSELAAATGRLPVADASLALRKAGSR